MCPQCYEGWKRAEEEKNKILHDEAAQWIRDYVRHVQCAFDTGLILKSHGVERIDSIHQECKYILEHIDDWKECEAFEEVFPEYVEEDNGMLGWQKCGLFPGSIIRKNTPVDFEAEFSKLKEKTQKRELESMIASFNAYDYSILSRVAGVTFRNEDGRKRQTIIRKMGKGYKDNDYDSVTLERYLFEGEDAIAVKLEGSQIGNIPRCDLPYIIRNWENYFRVDAFEVTGYDTLGVELRIVFRGIEVKE